VADQPEAVGGKADHRGGGPTASTKGARTSQREGASARARHTRKPYARPGLAFVPSGGAPPTQLCVAWRTDGTNPVVERFIAVATGAAPDATERSLAGTPTHGLSGPKL
jgi:hypothetical protein